MRCSVSQWARPTLTLASPLPEYLPEPTCPPGTNTHTSSTPNRRLSFIPQIPPQTHTEKHARPFPSPPPVYLSRRYTKICASSLSTASPRYSNRSLLKRESRVAGAVRAVATRSSRRSRRHGWGQAGLKLRMCAWGVLVRQIETAMSSAMIARAHVWKVCLVGLQDPFGGGISSVCFRFQRWILLFAY